MQGSQQQQQAPFQSASLYVGDLHVDVTEGLLFEMFNRVGPVASIRVCRDAVTRRSLGYAYVNFHNVQDAERALDTMNFTEIKNRPCRIMWSQRDPSLRKSGVGNVYVKNLAPTVDNKGLFDVFSVFGNILSCKVATDEVGASKGYGYVHYETSEAAQDAIQKINGMVVDEMEIYVGTFVRRQERAGQTDWTNLYVKEFPESWDEAKLTEVFGQYGHVSSVKLVRDADGKSKQFGFVNFADHEAAEKCYAELNKKPFEDESRTYELYINRAQKKVERSREIKTKMEALRHDYMSKFQGMNLYVKNLDDTITDDEFKSIFAPYGTITSARIMRDDQGSRGFGFVCYSSPEEATRAVSELNNRMIHSKPIFVTLHQRKEHRRAHLAATYGSRMAMARGFPAAPMPYMYMNQHQMAGGQPGMIPGQQPRHQFPMMGNPNMMANPRGAPRGMPNYRQQGGGGNYPPNMMPYMNQPGGGMQAPFKRPPMNNGPGGPNPGRRVVNGGRGAMVPGGPTARGVMPSNMTPGPSAAGAAAGAAPARTNGSPAVPAGLKYTSQARNQPQPNGLPPTPMMVGGGPQGMMNQQAQGMMPIPATNLSESLDHQVLAQADTQTQKNMIGERLYPLIHRHQPEFAGKITGMLLEMDNAELLHLLESPEALGSKVEEAIQVLQMHAGTN
jgi:polyadenylate-binding protein